MLKDPKSIKSNDIDLMKELMGGGDSSSAMQGLMKMLAEWFFN